MKKIRRTLLIFLLLLLAGGGFYFSHRKGNTTPISAQEIHLNTLVTVTLYGTDRTELLDGAFALCDHYEKLFSRTLPESEIYRLNHGEISEVSPETSELIQIGLSYGELSEGAFDISIEPVSSLWDFTSEDAVIPDEKELAEAVALVDYRKVHVNGNTVTFDTPGMGLDLGAIAKGYIADRIKEYLKKEGVEHALINLGGNVLCLGDKPEGTAFRIDRFPDEEIQKNLDMQMKNVKKAAQLGAHIGLGSDAGAYLVPHGTGTRDEYQYLRSAGVVDDVLEKTEMQVRDLFKYAF